MSWLLFGARSCSTHWVGPRPGLDALEKRKLCWPCQELNCSSSSQYPVTILTDLLQLLSSLNSVIQTACDSPISLMPGSLSGTGQLAVYQGQDDWKCISGRTAGNGSGAGWLAVYQGEDKWQCIWDRMTGNVSGTGKLAMYQG